MIFQQKLSGQKGMAWNNQSVERKILKQEYSLQQVYHLELKKKYFPKQKLQEFVTTKPVLQEMLKGLLQVKRKGHNWKKRMKGKTYSRKIT